MNIYNRHWDDQSQIRIRLETLAISSIFDRILANKYELVWSFILEYENSLSPFPERRIEIEELSTLATFTVSPDKNIRNKAINLSTKGLPPRDAIHLACAVKANCKYFITCDDTLVKKMKKVGESMIIINPADFIKREVRDE